MAAVSRRSRERRSRSPGRRRHSLVSPPRDKRGRSRSHDSGRGAKRKRSPETGRDSRKAVEKTSKVADSSRRKDYARGTAQTEAGENKGDVKERNDADSDLEDTLTNGDKGSFPNKASNEAKDLPLPPPPLRTTADENGQADRKADPESASPNVSERKVDTVSPVKKEEKPKKEKKDKEAKKHKKEKKEKKEKKSKSVKDDKVIETLGQASPNSDAPVQT